MLTWQSAVVACWITAAALNACHKPVCLTPSFLFGAARRRDVVGHRSPFLQTRAAVRETLQKEGFLYDR